ncbi:MAG: leucine-rich repeat domain-containing protein, partial [Ruminococcus callidus]|nr:leucine-rich repeat domain-containing protein [Ruminococcus callidus]
MKFKKIISAAVGAVMLCASLPIGTMVNLTDNVLKANAEDEIPSTGKCGENVYYSLSDDGVLTISGSGEMYDYVIETNPSPFYDNDLIKSVIIEKDVSSIGGLTFFYCLNLTSIIIPDSVTSIDYGAFSNCTNLTKITIPDSVTSIGEETFLGCSSLT